MLLLFSTVVVPLFQNVHISLNSSDFIPLCNFCYTPHLFLLLTSLIPPGNLTLRYFTSTSLNVELHHSIHNNLNFKALNMKHHTINNTK